MGWRFWLGLGAVAAAVVLVAGPVGAGSDPPPAASAVAEDDSTAATPAPAFPGGLGYWLDDSRAFGIGLDLSRVQPNVSSKLLPVLQASPPGAASRRIDTALNFDALAFALKLRWPSPGADGLSPSDLQPYLSFGPALFVARPDDLAALSPTSSQRDTSLSLGMLGGAGLSWHLWENASVFGEYRFTQSGSQKFLPLGRPIGRDANTSDLLYGLSVRF